MHTRYLLVMAMLGAATAQAQQFVNPAFQTGNFAGWSLTLESGSTVEGVGLVDIDAGGPLEESPAASFCIGHGKADLFQMLDLVAGTTYVVSLDYAVVNHGEFNNSQGGIFQLIQGNDTLYNHDVFATQTVEGIEAAPPGGLVAKCGHLVGQFKAASSGPRKVGVRLKRQAAAASYLRQWVDNFSVTVVPMGACCEPTGVCSMNTQADCGLLGGVYSGDGVACGPAICPHGACCKPTGPCEVRSSVNCIALGGVYQGDQVGCETITCPPPSVLEFVAPEGFASLAAGGGGYWLLSERPTTFQAVYAASEIDVVAGTPITGVSWRVFSRITTTTNPQPPWPDGVTANWTDYEITLSRSLQPPASMSPTFSANIGGDAVVVRTGPLSFAPYSFPGLAEYPFTNDWGPVVSFTAPYVYTGGDLLVTVRHSGNDSGTHRHVDGVQEGPVYGVRASAQWSEGSSATTGAGAAASVLRFAFEPAGAPCYPNCDASTAVPLLNIADFTCFLTRFAANDAYANCDGSTMAPLLNIADFTCFLTKFAGGCH